MQIQEAFFTSLLGFYSLEGGPYTEWGKTMYAALLIRENKNQSQDFQAVVVEVVRGEYGCGRQKQRMAYAAKLSKGFNDGMSASLHRADNAHGEQLVVISYDTCVCTGADGRATAAAWLVAPVTCRRGCGWVSRPDTRSGVRLLTRGCYCSGAGGSAPQLLKQKLRVGFAQALLPVRARPAPQEVTTEACEAPEVSEYLCRPCGYPRSHQTARGCIFSSVFVPDLALSRGHRHCRGCAAVGEPDCAGADLPQHLSLPISAQRGAPGLPPGVRCCTLLPRAGPAKTWRRGCVSVAPRGLLSAAAARPPPPTPAALCTLQWSPRLPEDHAPGPLGWSLAPRLSPLPGSTCRRRRA
ncbi:unnamed protein product [Rangifer tarandus platyrhynchus]|uniref:Uncharacterized protein n=1 Tax=Rangifer tarandus platyrhynchus TaxID=3082113 RepID=A0ABN8ZDQ8_RANTA|nr:unnamed protein product [Rangifer tarandus platyrhynchus]